MGVTRTYMKEQDVRAFVARVPGLHVDTYSPGGGPKRYRFFASDAEVSYFESDGLRTVSGPREAMIFAEGFAAGITAVRKEG